MRITRNLFQLFFTMIVGYHGRWCEREINMLVFWQMESLNNIICTNKEATINRVLWVTYLMSSKHQGGFNYLCFFFIFSVVRIIRSFHLISNLLVRLRGVLLLKTLANLKSMNQTCPLFQHSIFSLQTCFLFCFMLSLPVRLYMVQS